jgi:diacylglycerol kinase family enzyme
MLIIFNPAAGSRRHRRLARALAVLPGATVAETRGPGHAGALARDAVNAGYATVVAAGGDGTIAEVAAGLAGADVALGLLPLGTANVLARELGVPLQPEAAAAYLLQGGEVRLWPGIARFAGGGQRLFVQMLGAGFDAAVVTGLDLRLKQALGRAAYVAEAASQLACYRFPSIELRLDGGPPRRAASVVVTKGRLYAGPYLLASGATPLESGFHVAVMGGGRWRAVLAGGLLPLGLLPRLPGLEVIRARHVALLGSGVPAQADGDPAGMLPVAIEDAAGPLRLRLPRGAT